MSIDWNKVYNKAADKMKTRVPTAAPSVGKQTTPAADYDKEMARLQEVRRQAQVDMDMDTVNAADNAMKQLRVSQGKQTVADRIGDMVGAAASSTVGGVANTVGTVQQFLGKEDVDYTLADIAAEDRQRFTDSAKDGLGKVGQFAVDAGIAGLEMLGDATAGALLPGGGVAMMATRGFGSSAQEARQSGASVGEQMAYGLGSAGVSVLTEKLGNVSGVFRSTYGAGVLDKALSKLTAKPMGKLVTSALSEGGEEFLEAAVQPLLKQLTYDPDAAYDADWLADALYSSAVGGILGGFGGGVDVVTAGKAKDGAKPSAGLRATERTGVSSSEEKTPVRGVSVPSAVEANEGLAAAQIMAQAMAPTEKAAPKAGAAGKAVDIMEAEAQRLFGQEKTATPNKGEAAEVIKVLADSIPALKAEPIVAKTSSQAFHTVPGNTMAEKARKLFEGIKGIVVRPGFGDVEINGRSVKDDLSHGVGPAKAATIAAVPQVIQHGKQVDYQENWKGRGYDGYVFAAPVEMDGEPVYVAAVVKKTSKNRFYLHEVVDSNGNIIKIDDIESANPTSLAANGDAGTQSPSSTSDITITHPSDSVNTADGGRNAVGAAAVGFETPDSRSAERTSNINSGVASYTRQEGEATGRTRADYDALFRYQTMTEAQSEQQADNLLYVQQDGQRKFLRDVDEGAYNDTVSYLRSAPAWNGVMTDAAMLIKNELQGRSLNMEITEDEYTDWLTVMREHATETGRGTQAWAKWNRGDNGGGQATELEAWETLQKSSLPDERKQEIFRKIVQWDASIEGIAAGDKAAMKDIIMQVARERGVVNGVWGDQFTRVADSALESLTFDQLKQFAYSSTAALASDSTGADWGQKLKTVQILNMLSSPKTAARNLLGNTTFYGIDALAMDAAALIDMAVSTLTGTRSIAVGRSSLSEAAKALQMAVAEITLDVDMGGEKSRYGTGSNRTFKAGGNLIERTLSAIERNQAYLLTVPDEFFKGAARGTQRSTQRLVDSGKIKTGDQDYAAKQAEQLAKYRTFQDDSRVSVAIQEIHDVLNMLAGVGDSGKTVKGKTVHAFGAGDIVAPFTRVAGNLVSRGMEYTPVNAAKGVVEIVWQVARAVGGKGVDPAAQAKGVSDLARGMTGTAVAYGFMVLAKMGLLRQAEDEDNENVAALNQSEGISGTQLNITAAQRALSGCSAEWQYGDTLVDLASVEPLNLLMNLGTEMAKENQNPLVSSFKATVDSTMDASTELPVMQTVGNIVTDVVKYNNDPKEVLAEEAAKTLLSSAVPNVLAGVAKGLDDRPRNTYTGDDLWDIIQDTFKNKIPGLRETLPGSVNSMGEEKLYREGEAGLVNALLNPIGVNAYTQSDVSREMERVRGETGETGFYPTKRIPSELSADGEKVKLDYEARQDFQRDRGTMTMLTTADMMGSSYYKNADSATQVKLLTLCGDYAYQRAKANVMGEDAAEKWVLNAAAAQKELGISTTEYLSLYHRHGSEYLSGSGYESLRDAVRNGLSVEEYIAYKGAVKGLTADKDAKGNSIDGSKKAKVMEAIDGMDLSPTEKDWLYYLNGYSEKTIGDAPWH